MPPLASSRRLCGIALPLLAALLCTTACKRSDGAAHEASGEAKAFFAGGDGALPKTASPAHDLAITYKWEGERPFFLATDRKVSQAFQTGSGEGDAFTSELQSSVELARGEPTEPAEPAQTTFRLEHPSVDVEPELGSSAARLAGLARGATLLVRPGKAAGAARRTDDVPEAVVDLVDSWALALDLLLPTFPDRPLSSGDTWTGTKTIPAAGDKASIRVERSYTLLGTVDCRGITNGCALVNATLALSHTGRFVEDEDEVTVLQGSGTGALALRFAIDAGEPDAAELVYTMSTTINRKTTDAEAVTIRQERESRVLFGVREEP